MRVKWNNAENVFYDIIRKLLKIVSVSYLVCRNQKRIFSPRLFQIGKRSANVISAVKFFVFRFRVKLKYLPYRDEYHGKYQVLSKQRHNQRSRWDDLNDQ